jgi:hypothetical protein
VPSEAIGERLGETTGVRGQAVNLMRTIQEQKGKEWSRKRELYRRWRRVNETGPSPIYRCSENGTQGKVTDQCEYRASHISWESTGKKVKRPSGPKDNSGPGRQKITSSLSQKCKRTIK